MLVITVFGSWRRKTQKVIGHSYLHRNLRIALWKPYPVSKVLAWWLTTTPNCSSWDPIPSSGLQKALHENTYSQKWYNTGGSDWEGTSEFSWGSRESRKRHAIMDSDGIGPCVWAEIRWKERFQTRTRVRTQKSNHRASSGTSLETAVGSRPGCKVSFHLLPRNLVALQEAQAEQWCHGTR